MAELGGKVWGTHAQETDDTLLACYAASLQFFVEMGLAAEQARTALELAHYELEHGAHREGARMWQEAANQYSLLNDQPRLAIAWHNLAEADKQLDKAIECLQKEIK